MNNSLQGKFYYFDNPKLGRLSMIVAQSKNADNLHGKLVIVPETFTPTKLKHFLTKEIDYDHNRLAESLYDMSFTEKKTVLNWLGTNLNHRHSYLGRDAMQAVIKESAENGCTGINGIALASSAGFYRKLGCHIFTEDDSFVLFTSIYNPVLDAKDKFELDRGNSETVMDFINERGALFNTKLSMYM